MHSLFELLLISFSIASSNVARATQLPDNVDLVLYVRSNYFDTQRDDGKLVSELVGYEESSREGISLHELFARQAQGALKSDLQTFTGALGGIKAPSITQSTDPRRPFMVEGDTFPAYMEAAAMTCNRQNNACSNMVNALGVGGNAGDANGGAEGEGEAAPVQKTPAVRNPSTSPNSDPSSQSRWQNCTTPKATTSSSRGSTQATGAAISISTQQQDGNQPSGNNSNNNNNRTVQAGNQKRQSRMTLAMCKEQMSQCNIVVQAAAVQSFVLVNLGPDPNDPEFDLLCSA